MIRRARPEDTEAIADAFAASLESLSFLPRIHTPEEHITVADLEGMVEVTLALVDAARDA